MATSYKVLGQQSPSANTMTPLYTCPSSTSAIISTISVCNRGSTTEYFSIAVRPTGESLANKHYVAFNSMISANNTAALTIGITVNASDVISCSSTSSNITFNCYGSEIS